MNCEKCGTLIGERLIPGYPAPRVIVACECEANAIMDAEFKTWRAQIGDIAPADPRAADRQLLLSLTREILKTQQEILAVLKGRG